MGRECDAGEVKVGVKDPARYEETFAIERETGVF